ncbi:hypothetical protein BgiMline_034801 [Biomphalaria glabrata]|nr:hypothetical protein BgiMline_029368 [Biomphalaria glabrata]
MMAGKMMFLVALVLLAAFSSSDAQWYGRPYMNGYGNYGYMGGYNQMYYGRPYGSHHNQYGIGRNMHYHSGYQPNGRWHEQYRHG